MASYVVMAPPPRTGQDVRFVRDGFSLLALIVPLIWLLWHQLWIESALYLALALCLGAVAELLAWDTVAAFLSLLLSIYVALEGPALRQWALRRRGWRESAIVDAQDEDEAMERYFADGEHVAAYDEPRPPRPAPSASSAPALGLLSYPSRH